MSDDFDAKSMNVLATHSTYYRAKIRIAASKGKFFKIFPGGSSRLGWLRDDLRPLGFQVSAEAWGSDGDVTHIKVSWY